MSRIAKVVVLLALLPMTVTCGQRSAEGGAVPARQTADAVVPAIATPGSQGNKGIQQTLDENDAMIAENKRIIALDNHYLATDPDKLGRLQKQCEKRAGPATDAASARRVFTCVEQSW